MTNPLKIGLFICHCGFNIAGTIDVKAVREHFEKVPDVVALDDRYLCSDLGLKHLADYLKEKAVERVVIAACSPRLHGDLFRRAIAKAGINRFLVEFSNIREQNSWVHHDYPQQATEKAIDQIHMSIEKVKLAECLEMVKVPVEKATLVIGGGIAGIKAALGIADAGFQVYLVEKEPTIGGLMALFDKTFPTLDCSICILGPLMAEVKEHPKIKLYTYSEVTKVEGYVGNFSVDVKHYPRYVDEGKCAGCFDICAGACPITSKNRFYPRKAIDVLHPQSVPLIPTVDPTLCIGCKACEVACEREAIKLNQVESLESIKVGTIIVAIGAQLFDATKLGMYGYGIFENVITTMELERLLNADGPTKGQVVRPSDGKPVTKVAFVLCVGSRNEKINREWCSRTCCMASIKEAVLLKDRVPGVEVYINYTDIRSFGKGCEEFFNRARSDKRIRFYRSQISKVMKKDNADMLLIRGEDTLRSKLFETEVDLVVLAVGFEPSPDFQNLANILNISLGPDGFFLEAHLKIRPSEASIKGIYLAGCAQGPKDIPDSIAQAESAAMKAVDLMQAGEIEIEPNKARVDEAKCIHCRLCQEICSFHAIQAKKDKTTINLPMCVGCGACAAMCPAEAIEVPGFSKHQTLVQIDEALKDKKIEPLIIAFLCNWCSYAGADLAGTSKYQYPPNIRVIHVMCSAMVNPEYVIAALAKGADGVLIAGCHPQDCHYTTGFNKTATRYQVLRNIMEEIGFRPWQLRVESISAGEGKEFAKLVSEFVQDLDARKKSK